MFAIPLLVLLYPKANILPAQDYRFRDFSHDRIGKQVADTGHLYLEQSKSIRQERLGITS